MWQLLWSQRIPVLPPHPGAVHRRELPQRHVGQAGLRDPDAELGHSPGGLQPPAPVHRREHLRILAADPAAAHLAHPLVPLRLLQPHQGKRVDHRPLPLPEAVSERYSDHLPLDAPVPLHRCHHQQVLKVGAAFKIIHNILHTLHWNVKFYY